MTVIFLTLAFLWSVGCIGMTLFVIVSVWRDDQRGVAAAILLIGLPLMAVMAYLPWGYLAHRESPVLATLHKTEWECSVSHKETKLVMIGKILSPQTRTVCDAYTRVN